MLENVLPVRPLQLNAASAGPQKICEGAVRRGSPVKRSVVNHFLVVFTNVVEFATPMTVVLAPGIQVYGVIDAHVGSRVGVKMKPKQHSFHAGLGLV